MLFYTGVAIVDTIARMYPENFQWKIKHLTDLRNRYNQKND
jgi:uncharacterized protein YbbC (DUF1343 family)